MKIFEFETYIYSDYPILNLIKYNRRDMIAWSHYFEGSFQPVSLSY